jgi:hypothetical protein
VIGNFLNGTSFRGNAYGFKLESLLCLEETVAAPANNLNCPTLMHYLADLLHKNFPDTIEFMDEMPDVTLASKIHIPSVIDGVKGLSSGFTDLKAEIDTVKANECSANDKFLQVFEKFYASNAPKMVDLEKDIERLIQLLEELFVRFAEDVKARKSDPQLFFEIITKFSNRLKVNFY